MKIRVLFGAILFFLALRAQAQTADEIVKKAIAARGGLEKINAVQSERISGRVSLAQGIEGTVVLELQRPHKLHSEIMVEGQKVVRVYDGKSSGWTVNPFAENKEVQPMPEEELKGMSEESDLDGPLVDYKAKGEQIELAGKEELDGKAVYHLKLTAKDGDVRSYFLDAATFLTVKWQGIRKIEDQAMPWESNLSDYRDVDGLKFPFKIDQGSPGTPYQQSLTIEKVEVNPKIEESHFAKPAAPVAATP
ncbi:MAG TPA: outer membrane lipoprotein-sorting protein [Candidatus Angelobacter sp.]|nr:outer membrane lipoprotein-sorting protein [Candidatus Angelobacter sp.]